VDSGVRKEMMYDPKRNISTLKLTTISQSSATQRAGRSGRTAPGECHCLYSEQDFYLRMDKCSAPEVLRKPLSLAVLSLIEMNIVPAEFEWINPPKNDAIIAAEEELVFLGAITKNEDNGNKTWPTELGKIISQCQQEPKLVRMIYKACNFGFGHSAVEIASIFTVSNSFFYMGRDDKEKAEAKKSRDSFALEGGDVVSMYRVFQKYLQVLNGVIEEKDDKNKDKKEPKIENGRQRAKEWCRKNYINTKSMDMIISTRKELLRLFR
jgi:HrpA-like RNA helicase